MSSRRRRADPGEAVCSGWLAVVGVTCVTGVTAVALIVPIVSEPQPSGEQAVIELLDAPRVCQ